MNFSLSVSHFGLNLHVVLKRNIEQTSRGLFRIKESQISEENPYLELYSLSLSFKGKPILELYYHNRASRSLIQTLRKINRKIKETTKA